MKTIEHDIDMSDRTNNRWGVLFDLDGVLLDSEGQYSIFWDGMDKRYHTGVDTPDSIRIRDYHGRVWALGFTKGILTAYNYEQ